MPGAAPAAGLRRRLASALYEALLLIGVLALGFLLPYIILGAAFGVSVHGAVQWLHLYLVQGLYFVWCWRRGGQTLPMQTWKIRLVDGRSGNSVSPGKAWLRYSLAWLSYGALGAGLVWALFDRDRQFLHDRLAGTRLVRA